MSPFRVLLAGVAWRTLGTRHSGDILLRAMSGDDEQNRMLAGMSLVKAGDRSVDLIAERSARNETGAAEIRLLSDIGSSRAREALERISQTASGPAARTADECLARLSRR